MKFTTVLVNLALTATAMAAAINNDLTKRTDCFQLDDPNKPGYNCGAPGCFTISAIHCCSGKWNSATAICI